MRRFIIKFSSFVIFLQLSILLLHLIDAKLKQRNQTNTFRGIDKSKINTVFIGSSRTLHQLVPSLFDENTGCTESFNLATGGNISPKPYSSLEFVIDNKESLPNLEYIFFELQEIKVIKKKFKNRILGYYDLSLKDLVFLIEMTWSNNSLKRNEKYNAIFRLIHRFLMEAFEIGKIQKLLLGKSTDVFSKAVHDNSGYLSYSTIINLGNKRLGKLEKDFQKNGKKKLEELATFTASAFKNRLADQQVSEQFGIIQKKLESLRLKAKTKNIELILVLVPLSIQETKIDQYLNFIKIMRENKDFVTINLADPNLYPEFYKIENVFNMTHLNDRGAKLFTKEIAQSFRNQLDEKLVNGHQ